MPPLILGVLAVLGLVGFGVFKTGHAFIDALKVQIDPLQKPNISFRSVEFPIKIKIDNPTKTGIKLDSLFVSISQKVGENWVHIANSKPDLVNIPINPYATSEFNLKLQTTAMSAISTARTILQNFGNNQLKIEAKIGVEGQVIEKVELMTI